MTRLSIRYNNANMNEDFSPQNMVERALRLWWLIVVLMLWGGAIGWVLHRLQPPIYEARAVVGINVDISRTGSLLQLEEDQAIGTGGIMFLASPVPEQVVAAANQAGIPMDLETLKRSTTLERYSYQWVLRWRHSDPKIAADLTNLWLQKGYNALLEAWQHAEKAASLRVFLEGLESCLRRSTDTEPSSPLCSIQSLAALQKELQVTGANYQQEKLASRGILPSLKFSIIETAAVPDKPVLYGRNTFILSGSLIGLLFSLWAIGLRWPERLERRLRRG